MSNVLKRSVILVYVFFVGLSSFAYADKSSHAVLLVYHHVATNTPKITSVSPQRFEEHLQYLAKNHSVWPLPKIVESLLNKQSIPTGVVGITFDDGYQNIYENAHPLLKKYKFPYTVFINPPMIGKSSLQLTWEQIRIMSKGGALFANHGDSHAHLLERDKAEPVENWLRRVYQDISSAHIKLEEELGVTTKYFAYPYGEFDNALRKLLAKKGYVGFAQHSGAISSFSDFTALPRFPVAGRFSKLESLKPKLSSLAMNVRVNAPEDTRLANQKGKTILEFEVLDEKLSAAPINCFKSGVPLVVEKKDRIVRLNLTGLSKAGRHKVTCTALSDLPGSRYYWVTFPFFVPKPDGTWVD